MMEVANTIAASECGCGTVGKRAVRMPNQTHSQAREYTRVRHVSESKV